MWDIAGGNVTTFFQKQSEVSVNYLIIYKNNIEEKRINKDFTLHMMLKH